MPPCQGCGATLANRHRLYCSNQCQQRHRQQLLTAQWLATGIGSPRPEPDNYIRKFLSTEQGRQCAICHLDAAWNGRPLSFILDHIDGNSENNARPNLRLVCPNCDSQLPTYKSRNRGNGRHWRTQRRAEGKSF
jgi:hypothetical protein